MIGTKQIKRLAVAGILIGLIWTVGCTPKSSGSTFNRTWPAPPEPARFKLVQIVRDASDFGNPSVLEALHDIVTDRKKRALLRPQGVAVRGDDYLCVTDVELRGVHVFNLHSSKSVFIDRAEDEPLVSPVGVAVFGTELAVSDSARKQVFVFTRAGRFQRTIQKPGGFQRPTGLGFFAKEQLLYVVDTLANEVCIFDLSGRLVRRFGSRGTDPGQFNYPTHVFVDQRGKAYVTDSLNFRVQVFDRSGKFLFEIGKHGDASGYVGLPKGVAVDRFGHIYIADSYFGTVQVFDQQGQFLLGIGEPGTAPGAFQLPCGLAVGSDDRIFICDSHNSRLQVIQYIGTNNAQLPSAQ